MDQPPLGSTAGVIPPVCSFVTRSTGNRKLGKQRSGGARELLPLCFTVTDIGPYSFSVF